MTVNLIIKSLKILASTSSQRENKDKKKMPATMMQFYYNFQWLNYCVFVCVCVFDSGKNSIIYNSYSFLDLST